jgi:hypothetical protein
MDFGEGEDKEWAGGPKEEKRGKRMEKGKKENKRISREFFNACAEF